MIAEFKVGISGSDNGKLLIEVFDFFFANAPAPAECNMDNGNVIFNRAGLQDMVSSYKEDIFIRWEGIGYIRGIRGQIVLFGLSSYEIDPQKVLSALEKFSFELASFGTVFPEWLNPVHPYDAPSFSSFHLPHGWACAFKGRGYDRLVSGRWLDYGPWKQYKGADGTQLVQFHRLDIDADSALKEAEVAHQIMGISDDGGFIQRDYIYKYDNKGLYDPGERKWKVIVHGTNISHRQMLDAAAARVYQPFDLPAPVQNIAFVFMDEQLASAHLHALWLRGLECRSITRGKELRMDAAYTPSIQKPAWVDHENQ